MRNDYKDMKAILDRAGIAYTETESDIPGGGDAVTLMLNGLSGIYFTFFGDGDDVAWKLTEYGTKYSVKGDEIMDLPDEETILRNVINSGKGKR